VTDRFTPRRSSGRSRPWPRGRAGGALDPAGLRLSLGITLVYLALIVLIPLAALAIRPWEIGLDGVWKTLTDRGWPRR
jgi:sulfate transport system permease protein